MLQGRKAQRSGPVPTPDPGANRTPVLVISASMGAGHDGAARELAHRLEAVGHPTTVRDFLDSGPFRIGAALRGGYEFELKHVPAAYDATYRFWYRVPWLAGPIAWFICLLTKRRVLRWVRASGAGVVVSTYPLSTLALGRLRATGRLAVPAVNFITDFGVHPLWVHRGIDLNLAIHPRCAEVARARTGRAAITCGPLVAERFAPSADPAEVAAQRVAVRAELGLSPDDRAVLVVAGSWGVGDVNQTLQAVAAGGRFVPVVICGRDEQLRSRLAQQAADEGVRAVIFGWTDRMAELMIGCDALVENAGGLTSLEALRSGLPVVSFNPIAGHGRENTSAMAAAGISRLAADEAELAAALYAVTTPGPERSEQVTAGLAMFVSDGARHVIAATHLPRSAIAPWRRPVRAATRAAVAVIALAALGWTALTTGVGVAAAAGAGVAHPPQKAGPVVYLGVRLDESEVNDPVIAADLERLRATAVIDAQTAAADPRGVRLLVLEDIDVEDGGHGDQHGLGQPASDLLWTRANQDVRAARLLDTLTGHAIKVFVPGRRINAWDVHDTHDAHLLVVVPDTTLVADRDGTSRVPALQARQIYLVNGEGASDTRLAALLGTLEQRLVTGALTGAPLDALT